jgi:hypothetical protein
MSCFCNFKAEGAHNYENERSSPIVLANQFEFISQLIPNCCEIKSC